MPWLRRIVTGLSLQRLRFASKSVHVVLWWAKWHWDRFLFQLFGFSLSI
jgi:hypothetical protein